MILKEKAQTRERELAAIVESTNDAIISKNLDGIIKSWNAGASKMYGYSEDEMLGKHISKIIPEEKMKEYEYIMEQSLNNKPNIIHTLRKREDGAVIHVSLTTSPVKNQLGRSYWCFSNWGKHYGTNINGSRAKGNRSQIFQSS